MKVAKWRFFLWPWLTQPFMNNRDEKLLPWNISFLCCSTLYPVWICFPFYEYPQDMTDILKVTDGTPRVLATKTNMVSLKHFIKFWESNISPGNPQPRLLTSWFLPSDLFWTFSKTSLRRMNSSWTSKRKWNSSVKKMNFSVRSGNSGWRRLNSLEMMQYLTERSGNPSLSAWHSLSRQTSSCFSGRFLQGIHPSSGSRFPPRTGTVDPPLGRAAAPCPIQRTAPRDQDGDPGVAHGWLGPSSWRCSVCCLDTVTTASCHAGLLQSECDSDL